MWEYLEEGEPVAEVPEVAYEGGFGTPLHLGPLEGLGELEFGILLYICRRSLAHPTVCQIYTASYLVTSQMFFSSTNSKWTYLFYIMMTHRILSLFKILGHLDINWSRNNWYPQYWQRHKLRFSNINNFVILWK